MAKKRIITTYKNLPVEFQGIFNAKFSDENWENIIKVETGKEPFYAVLVETEDISYLVKVEVKSDDDITALKDLLEPNLNEPKEEESSAPDIEEVADYEE